MTQQTALALSHASWACVQAQDRDGWLALMADDVVIEDPIGPGVTNPDGKGARGKEAVAAFYDANIGPNSLTVTCHESFPSCSPREIAHLMTLSTQFPNGAVAAVRGVFTYQVDEFGRLTNLRGYWTLDSLTFTDAPAPADAR
jgi:steroid delta-isomerase